MTHRAARSDLTADYVRELLDYNPQTGLLTWKRSKRPGWKGKIAGKQFSRGQIQVQIDGHMYLAHRLIWLMMTDKWPAHQLDHIDGDPANNRWDNLRPATASENCLNRSLRPDNTSGFKGVHKLRDGRYRAYINVRGKREHLGYFYTAKGASDAYRARAKELHGGFRDLSKPAAVILRQERAAERKRQLAERRQKNKERRRRTEETKAEQRRLRELLKNVKQPDDLTAEYVHSVLSYDPETGILTRKKNGKRAGWRRPDGRIGVYVGKHDYLAHRVIWLMQSGEWPTQEIDHIDLNPSNNRWDNLRLATNSQNMAHRSLQSNNTSGFKGVSFFKPAGVWRAFIQFNGKAEWLGYFNTAEEAHAARRARAKELHGEFDSKS